MSNKIPLKMRFRELLPGKFFVMRCDDPRQILFRKISFNQAINLYTQDLQVEQFDPEVEITSILFYPENLIKLISNK